MLSKLHIQNYAIIDDLEVNFSSGLNIITGETGAGKSILMGALNLILGQRADSSVLHDTTKKCIIEGRFKLNNNDLVGDFFMQHELDLEPEIIIRREITSNGKSRSFINDTPVNLSQVKLLSIFLVDLHQQFDTLEISSENFQREVLDALAGNSLLLLSIKEKFDSYSSVKKELFQLRQQQDLANKELDYHTFLFEELEELSLQENELEELDAALQLLNNAENIKLQLENIYSSLSESEHPLVHQLKSLSNKLKMLEPFHAAIEDLSKRLTSVSIEVQDISSELVQIDHGIKYDADRIAVINDRISDGYKLLKKHGAHTTAELLQIKVALQLKLDSYADVFTSIEKLELAEKKTLEDCVVIAKKISINRLSQVDSFVDKVNKLLVKVGMPNAKLKVQINPTDITSTGMDSIDFLFDANKSNKFEPLGKVASGGELSRLMLSIKSLVAQKLSLPTLIFDEIDTGISGEAAKQVGLIMKELSAAHQLIAITHQPQIAARATNHYFVYKEVQGNKISTRVSVLNKEERIVTIAKMLGGEKPTAAALENAKEMIGN